MSEYFPPPWSILDPANSERINGWIAFQDAMRKSPRYYGLPQWISVRAQEPPKDEGGRWRGLVFTKEGNIEIETFEPANVGWSNYGFQSVVTHWMELPKAPHE